MAMNKENQPLFQENGYRPTVGVAFHNIGLNGVLDSIDPALAEAVHAKYQTRGGHIPYANRNGIIATHQIPGAQVHMEYLSGLYGTELAVFSLEEITMLASNNDVLVVPYVRTSKADELLSRTGARVWGLPPEVVDFYKNKAEFHRQVAELGNENFLIPDDVEVCAIADCNGIGLNMLRQMEENYSMAGIVNYEPFGLMLRAAEADGGYGSCIVRRINGRVHVLLDGEYDSEKPSFDNTENGWKEALDESQHHLLGAMDPQKEQRVVVSRLMDLAASPGLSVVVHQGEFMSLGWNGQIQANGGSACVGTSKYTPQNPDLVKALNKYEDRTAQGFAAFLNEGMEALGYDPQLVTGIANTDLMIPGPNEVKYQKARGNQEPDRPTVAEINPRFTNFTDGVLAAVRIQESPQTVASMRMVINHGITMIDRYKVPNGMNSQQFRDIVQSLDNQMLAEGARVVLRMPTTPNAGLIIVGDVNRVKHALDRAVGKVE